MDDDAIVKDYSVTRIGLESGKNSSLARFGKLWDNPAISAGVVNAFSSRLVTGFCSYAGNYYGSIRPTVMVRSLKMLREDYGGAEGYLKDRVGFTEEDIQLIKTALLGPSHTSQL